jgi:hypothetical protein
MNNLFGTKTSKIVTQNTSPPTQCIQTKNKTFDVKYNIDDNDKICSFEIKLGIDIKNENPEINGIYKVSGDTIFLNQSALEYKGTVFSKKSPFDGSIGSLPNYKLNGAVTAFITSAWNTAMAPAPPISAVDETETVVTAPVTMSDTESVVTAPVTMSDTESVVTAPVTMSDTESVVTAPVTESHTESVVTAPESVVTAPVNLTGGGNTRKRTNRRKRRSRTVARRDYILI